MRWRSRAGSRCWPPDRLAPRRTLEGVVAELAARVVGESAKDALRLLERLVAVDEQRLPIERLRHPAIIAAMADCRTRQESSAREASQRIGNGFEHARGVWGREIHDADVGAGLRERGRGVGDG